MISPAQTDEMVRLARQAAARAYAPYSRFGVGVAILTGSGRVYSGCNVENASYGLTMCAERVAVGQAVAGGDLAIAAITIYTPTPSPTPPCGACRQVLAEFGSDMHVFCVCDGPAVLNARLADLLPGAFALDAAQSRPAGDHHQHGSRKS